MKATIRKRNHIPMCKNDRDLGKLGESFLSKLAAEVGIIANKASEDETDWDFLLEFPMDKSH